MDALPPALTRLTAALNGLPGVGPRSAERLALHLAQSPESVVRGLSAALLEALEQVQGCDICGALTQEQPCPFCRDDRRAAGLVCVVENAVDIVSVEKAGSFKGRYHVLGGKISPINGVGPEDLSVAALEDRAAAEGLKELIVALGSDVEGDATAHYLAKRFGARGIKVSRLAQGLPVGGGLEYADELTLTRALEGRTTVE